MHKAANDNFSPRMQRALILMAAVMERAAIEARKAGEKDRAVTDRLA
jgi:hypothetical protein